MKITKNMRLSAVEKILGERGLKSARAAAELMLDKLVIEKWRATYPPELSAVAPWIYTGRYVTLMSGGEVNAVLESVYTGRDNEVYMTRHQTPHVTVDADIQEALDDRQKARDEVVQTTELLLSVLNACNTTKQLAEMAPELLKYVTDDPGPSTALVDQATLAKVRQFLNQDQQDVL